MKVKLLALCALLSVADAFAQQQKYLLPIGSNVNNRPAKVSMAIWNNDIADEGVSDRIDYTPAMGDLDTVVRSRFSILVSKFNPTPNSENDEYGIVIIVDPGPLMNLRFHLRNGVIPPEVLEVKLQYGASVGWKLQGVTAVALRLYKDGNLVKLWSTKDENSGDSPCDIGSAQSILTMGTAVIRIPYSLPWLKENWWDYGEITIEAHDGWATFYNANGSPRDGELIAVSEPPPVFLETLHAPEMPKVVGNTPHIAKITRILGNVTEIVVEGEAGGTITVESSEKLGGEWIAISTPLVLTSAGKRIFTHATEAPSCFYRLRSADSSSPQ